MNQGIYKTQHTILTLTGVSYRYRCGQSTYGFFAWEKQDPEMCGYYENGFSRKH